MKNVLGWTKRSRIPLHLVLLELGSASQSIRLAVVLWCAIVSHKCAHNKIHTERSPAKTLNRSESSCDKTVTAYREDLINSLSWTLKISVSPSLVMCDSCQIVFFHLVICWGENYCPSREGGNWHICLSGKVTVIFSFQTGNRCISMIQCDTRELRSLITCALASLWNCNHDFYKKVTLMSTDSMKQVDYW